MSESALLRAVRDRIRLSETFADHQVLVELAEEAMPTSANLQILILPEQVRPGPHNRNGTCSDTYYDISVIVAMRGANTPRDRNRNLLVGLVSSFETIKRAIDAQIDWSYATNDAANALILAEEGSSEGFMEPLGFNGMGPVQSCPVAFWGISTDGRTKQTEGFMRSFRYGDARRMITR